jgi:hypothetical protein
LKVTRIGVDREVEAAGQKCRKQRNNQFLLAPTCLVARMLVQVLHSTGMLLPIVTQVHNRLECGGSINDIAFGIEASVVGDNDPGSVNGIVADSKMLVYLRFFQKDEHTCE